MGALLQLERFDLGAEKPAPAPVFAQSDLEAAFAEGFAQGRQEAEAQRLGQICSALAALSERLAAESAARAASAEDQLRAIAPLIGALLDGIIPAVARGRLEAAPSITSGCCACMIISAARSSAAGGAIGSSIGCGGTKGRSGASSPAMSSGISRCTGPGRSSIATRNA